MKNDELYYDEGAADSSKRLKIVRPKTTNFLTPMSSLNESSDYVSNNHNNNHRRAEPAASGKETFTKKQYEDGVSCGFEGCAKVFHSAWDLNRHRR